jgi:hypothetical protein
VYHADATVLPEIFLLLSSLSEWKGPEQQIADGLAIRRLKPAEMTAVASSHSHLQHHGIDSMASQGYWLCYEFENGHPPHSVKFRRRQDAAFKMMHHALYAIQILLPIGASNLFLLYRQTEDAPRFQCSEHRPAYIGTAWARLCDVPASFAEDIPVLLARVRDAFRKPTLRLQIPVWLLEQGLSAPDRHIRILLWATGLDGVTRSGGVAAFHDRLCSLLGADTEIFPPGTAACKPQFRVAEVAADLYLLRTEMAHGLPFHQKFRKKREFIADTGAAGASELVNCRYDQVLEECAGFLLCRALREVFLRNISFDVQAGCWSPSS